MVLGLVKVHGQRLCKCDADSMSTELLRGLDEGLIAALKPAMIDQAPATGDRSGPLISTAFVLTLEDAQRFSKSRHVGGYLVLTPTQKDSGDSHPQLKITKAGDCYLRTLLVLGAHYNLGAHGPDSDLRRWGQKLAGGESDRQKQRGVVAVARKLAVLLQRL